ncbi:MAG: hypothetical protein MRQ13_00940 [Candidatus Midichloria sp.]|nr:hypothetical protein [Candidatus Midichloria sp.]
MLDYHSYSSDSILNNLITTYIELYVSSINLFNQEIHDFALNADIMNGELYINKAYCPLPGNGNNRISGAMAARYDVLSQMLNSITKYYFIPIGVSSPITFDVKPMGQMPKLNTEFDITQVINFVPSESFSTPTIMKQS